MSFLLHPTQWLLLFQKVPKAWRLGFSLLLGIGISFFFATRVQAAQTVLLQSRDIKTSVSLTELQAFATEGETSEDLQAFFQQTQDNPQEIRRWLNAEITPPPRSATSIIPDEFILLQINKMLGDPLEREDLAPLGKAVGNAVKNDATFSVMEILEQYPGSEVRLEVSRLQQVFSDVSLFVTRIEPILQIAKELLPELICECNVATAPSSESSTPDEATIVYNDTKQNLRSALFSDSPANLASTLIGSESSSQVHSDLSFETNTLLTASANAATTNFGDRDLVFEFGPVRPSISIQELTTFAETGELSPGWRFYLNVANVSREDLRKALNQTVKVDLKVLDTALNTLPGEFLLYEVGKVVHTPSKTANIQALRSALVLSAAPDNELSLLEVLQQYPTSGIHIDGLRLARLGRNIDQFKQSGGIGGAVVDLEGWLVQLQASAAENLCECDAATGTVELIGDSPTSSTIAPVQDLTIPASSIAEFLPANWQPVASHREDRGIIKVVWLQGTPYEMGYQHGQLLHDEIASISNEALTILRFVGKGLALGRLATKRSYPEILQECQGLTDATQDIGMTLDACMVLAYGDVYQEIFSYTLPNVIFWDGCSQFVATNAASEDGYLYHGSTVDNDNKPIPYIINNPVVFVRQPNGKLPHTFVTYPGVVWPNSGMNVAGISIGLDTAHPHDASELSLEGRSNVQIMRSILETATSFDAATEIMETQPRVRANLIMLTDGKSREAGVFEFTGKNLAVRPLQENGVLYTTNHFVLEEMYNKQPLPVDPSSESRFKRYAQLMEPDGVSSLYGKFNPEMMARVLRDRVNPATMQASPLDVFDDDASPGGNGSLRQAIYDPERLLLWVAAGQPPVPQNPFTCFSMGKMLGFPNAVDCASPAIE